MPKPNAERPRGKRRNRLLTAVFAGLALGTSSVFWSVASPALGPIYDALRTIETGGLWRLTHWSQAFRSVPHGQPHPFLSIYQSSIPFGLFFAVLIATIGALAFEKRRTRHLYARIVPGSGNLSTDDVRRRMGRVFAHLAAPKALPSDEWNDDTSPNPFADLPDLRNPVRVRVAVQTLTLPLARALFLTLTADQPGDTPIADLRPADVEAAAWRATRAVPTTSAKAESDAQAALSTALVTLITRPAETPALAARDEFLRTPGSTADMMTALIAHTRQTTRFPPVCLGWLRWSVPHLAPGFLTAGHRLCAYIPDNDNART
jgi:hypothetical protein